MTLPAPTLDDRTFQDIVNEAKRLIPRYCPEWTDHNVSDPGVALIELLAWMSEAIIYRVNQVPDRLYVKFLELMGIDLLPASPARTEVLFLLAAPPTDPIRVPAGTQVATGDSTDEPVVFSTDLDLTVRKPDLHACLTRSSTGAIADVWDELRHRTARVECFPTLRAGDALYLGFAEGLAGNLLRIDVETSAEGAGIRPEDPPRSWQAWDGTKWRPTRLLSDSSDGLNTTGSVTLLLPPRHEAMPVGHVRAFWLRCRLMPLREGQLAYDRSPKLDTIAACSLGGVASAHHAEAAGPELLGISSGEPAQVFQVRRAPLLPRRAVEHVRVIAPTVPSASAGNRAGTATSGEDWSEVADFTDTEREDRVYTWSSATGEIRFPPHIRQATGDRSAERDPDERTEDDGIRRCGAIPAANAQIWVTGYRYGGGRRGNVGSRTLTSLRTSIPSVAEVYNLDPAIGGVDAETVENAKVRGPLQLRGGNRAVTAADFERLTLEAARGVARARCLPPQAPGEPVRILVVPHVDIRPDLLELEDLDVPEELEQMIVDYLEERRLLTMQIVVGKPSYLGISIAASVRAAAGMRHEGIVAACDAALYRYLNPIVGGPEGHGWPFGRELNIGQIFGVLGGVPGVLGVEDVMFSTADFTRPSGPERVHDDRAGNVIRLPEGSLFASCNHRVVIMQ